MTFDTSTHCSLIHYPVPFLNTNLANKYCNNITTQREFKVIAGKRV